MRQGLVRDAASVDEPVLQIRLAAVVGWQPDPAGDCDIVAFAINEQRLGCKCVTAQAAYALQDFVGLVGGFQIQDSATIVSHGECDIGSGQCETTYPLVDMPELSALGAQELFSRRCVVKKIVDFDGRSGRMRRGRRFTDVPIVGLHGPRRVVAATRQRQARY